MKSAIASLLLLAIFFAPTTWAEEEAEAEAGVKEEIIYVELKPSFVANYQARKIRYLKADVTLQVEGSATAEAIARHKPVIRHNLVMLFSRQIEEQINTMEGKLQLKEDALREVISALEMESEPSGVKDILFTSFILD